MVVEGVFETNDNEVLSMLEELGVEFEDNKIYIRRVYNPSLSKNSFFINDVKVMKKSVEEIFSKIVDLIGQHEHQNLLDLKNHIRYLDKFSKIEDKVKEYQHEFYKLQQLEKELSQLKEKSLERERRIDYLKYSIDEIEKANLSPEDEKIFEERKLISNYEKIAHILNSIHESISSDEYGFESKVVGFINSLSEFLDFDERFKNLIEILEDIDVKLQEVSDLSVNIIDSIDFSEERIAYLDQRIELIENFKRKYGNTIEDILAFKENAEKELETLTNFDERIEELENQIIKLKDKIKNLALYLSKKRRENAFALQEKLLENLKNIGMEKTKFIVKISFIEDDNSFLKINNKGYRLYKYGIDYVEFGISPNVGEAIKPLRKIASGGEISRIMLALKLALREVDPVETFVFDEIDTGIGGNTANLVGREIKRLALQKQIILITHLPQIAAYSENHIFIEKKIINEKTVIRAKTISGDEKVKEIARMLSGKSESIEALEHARTLIKEKENEKII